MNEKNTKENDKNELPEENPADRAVTVVPKRRNMRRAVFVAIAVVLVCVTAGFAGAQLYTRLTGDAIGGIANHQSVENDGNKAVTQEEESIASVVKKVSPSVVSVITQSRGESRFYGERLQEGAGTGIVVSKDGYVMTNKHVIDGANTVRVVLSDGTSYENVKVLGSDPLNDVAFLKIPGVSNLQQAELGDSTSIQVGQKVVAIGNSLGQYQNTVTSGIISGTGRPVAAQDGESVESLTDLIQTDAAINPGNSGGPLLNLSGQVIGINTAIIQEAQGIGFAIPIGATKGILKSVLRGDDVQRAFLGINYLPITPEVARHYKLPVKQGAYVFNGSGGGSAVVKGSPADDAGIKNKDIITKVGGVEVGDKGGVASLVGEYAPGDTIEMEFLRDGKTHTVRVTLRAYEG